MYFAELDVTDYVQARGMGLRSIRIPSETVFKTSLAVQESFGVPTSASATGLAMDADRILSVDKAMDGDTGLKVRFLQSSGMNSSALEHSVPEQLWSTPGSPAEGVSAVKAIQIAMEQGIPIYTVTRDNIATVMPVLSLDAEVKSAITDAVNAGMEVTVPQTNIAFHGTAVVGYIAIDPETGAGAYMISGGDSGARLVLGMLTVALYTIGTGLWNNDLTEALEGCTMLLVTAVMAVKQAIDFFSFIIDNYAGIDGCVIGLTVGLIGLLIAFESFCVAMTGTVGAGAGEAATLAHVRVVKTAGLITAALGVLTSLMDKVGTDDCIVLRGDG